MSRLTTVALLVAPLLLATLAVGLYDAERDERDNRAFSQRLGDLLEKSAAASETDGYVQLQVWPLIKAFRTDPDRLQRRIESTAGQLRPAGQQIDFFFFDASGRVTSIQPPTAANQWLMRQMAKGLRLRDMGMVQEQQRRLVKAMGEVFGRGIDLITLRNARHRLIRSERAAGSAWLCWTFARGRGLLVLVRAIPPTLDRFARALAARRLDRLPGLMAGIGIPTEDRWQVLGTPAGVTVTASTVATIHQRSCDQGLEQADVGAQRWAFRQGDEGRVFFAGMTRAGRSEPGVTPNAWLIGFFVVATLTLLALWRFDHRARSLRQLTVALFVLGGLTPTLLLTCGAIAIVGERHATLVSRVLAEQGEVLKRIDEGFVEDRDRLKDEFVRTLRRGARLDDRAAIASATAPLRRGELRTHIEFRAPSGEALYVSADEDAQFGDMLDIFFRNMLATYAPKRYHAGRSSRNRRGRENSFAGNDSAVTILPRMLQKLGTLAEANYFLWDFYADPACPAALGAVFVRPDRLAARYLRRALAERHGVQGGQLRVAGINLASGRWISAGVPRRGALSHLVLQSRFLNRPVSGRIRVARQYFWFTVSPTRELALHALIALSPERAIDEQINRLAGVLFAGTLTAIIAALVLGTLVSQRLLTPLAALSEAIVALRHRRFGHIIALARHDELGQLAHSFNEMFEGLREFDLARAVQGGLLPGVYPTIPGYTVAGAVRFARDLGGDCLDCRILNNQRVFMLIGDVSGHGVASALLMASVKAVVTLWAEAPQPTLPDLVTEIDRMLRESRRQRTFLSLFAGILDPANATVTAVSAGHQYPLHRHAHGAIDWTGRPAYPLGARKQGTPIQQYTIHMSPGSTLLLYTDGLVEAVTGDGRPFGYERLAAWIGNLRPGAAADAIADLLSFHQQVGAIVDDDVTVLALRRDGGGAP